MNQKTNNQKLTKCNFCKFWSPQGCWGKPDSYQCKEATDEFYAYLRNLKINNNKKPYRR